MPAAVRTRLPAVIAVAALVEFQLELALLVPVATPHRALAALLLLVIAGGIAAGRRAPLTGLLCVYAALAVLPALSAVYYRELVLPFGAGFVAAYWLGARGGRRQLAAGLAAGIALGLAATMPYDDDAALTSGLFTLAVTLGAPMLIGRLLRSRAALNRTLRDKAALLERQRAGAAGRAVADERTRIAGELHDVVAHALSAMTVQATGARRLTLTRPALARDAFGAIEAAGREALDELRLLLGVLRREEPQLTLAPQPSLRHARSLARRTSAAGLPLSLRVDGEERELPAGLDVTAYRVLHDALGAAPERRAEGPAAPAASGSRRADGPAATGGRIVRWLRRPFVADAIAAAVLAVAAAVEVIVSPDRDGPLLANAALAFASALPLAWRRRAPLAALVTALSLTLLMGLTLTPVEHLFVPFLVVLGTAYSCAAHRDGREAWAGLAVVVAGAPVLVTTWDGQAFMDVVFPALIGAFAWLAGRAVRARTRLTVELHETAARLAEASEDERRLAAVDERRRIARELHDLVAHSISVMVVQAGGARRILDRDPGRALEAATRIERTGREALAEMRHLLGMLSGGAEPPALAPQPTLAEVGELVARARMAGLPAALDVRGAPRPLPAGLDLAAYRIVQEALTNAIKHARGAATTVTVEWGEQRLALEIRDGGLGGAADGAGHGLVGMRERVRLYGGELEAGPVEGGWCVRATLPVEVRELSLV